MVRSCEGASANGTARPQRVFQRTVAETADLLMDRGLKVAPAAIEDVVEGLAQSAARRLGIAPEDALTTLEPRTIAEMIVIADHHGPRPSVRRVREDSGSANLTVAATGQLLKAVGQAAKYASLNHDEATMDHAADLVTEFGSGLYGASDEGTFIVPRGVLAETAQILDLSAERFAAGTWSTCPCGKDHGQEKYDVLMPDALRADAELARQLLVSAIAADQG
jgi:hypothetical protein